MKPNYTPALVASLVSLAACSSTPVPDSKIIQPSGLTAREAIPLFAVRSEEDLNARVRSWVAVAYPNAVVQAAESRYMLGNAVYRVVPLDLPSGERKVIYFAVELALQ
jgi:hypothetical protein